VSTATATTTSLKAALAKMTPAQKAAFSTALKASKAATKTAAVAKKAAKQVANPYGPNNSDGFQPNFNIMIDNMYLPNGVGLPTPALAETVSLFALKKSAILTN